MWFIFPLRCMWALKTNGNTLGETHSTYGESLKYTEHLEQVGSGGGDLLTAHMRVQSGRQFSKLRAHLCLGS